MLYRTICFGPRVIGCTLRFAEAGQALACTSISANLLLLGVSSFTVVFMVKVFLVLRESFGMLNT